MIDILWEAFKPNNPSWPNPSNPWYPVVVVFKPNLEILLKLGPFNFFEGAAENIASKLISNM